MCCIFIKLNIKSKEEENVKVSDRNISETINWIRIMLSFIKCVQYEDDDNDDDISISYGGMTWIKCS